MSNSRGPYINYTAAQKNGVPIPDKFLCDYCKKMKSAPQYSNKEKDKYRHQQLTNKRTNYITAKLRCRACTGQPGTELQCTGPCGLWRSLDEFSKAARTRPEHAWCTQCTNWKEAMEPGVTLMPAPNNDVAPDEERLVRASYDPEGEADSDDDDFGYGITANVAAMTLGSTKPSQNQIPTPAPRSMVDENLPPHLRGLKSQTSVSNPYEAKLIDVSEAASGPAEEDDGGGWVTEDSRRRRGKMYSAWDANGVRHDRLATPATSTIGRTTPSSAGGVPITPKREVTTGKGGWARVPGNKTKGFSPQVKPGPSASLSKQQYIDDPESEDEM